MTDGRFVCIERTDNARYGFVFRYVMDIVINNRTNRELGCTAAVIDINGRSVAIAASVIYIYSLIPPSFSSDVYYFIPNTETHLYVITQQAADVTRCDIADEMRSYWRYAARRRVDLVAHAAQRSSGIHIRSTKRKGSTGDRNSPAIALARDREASRGNGNCRGNV